MSEWKNTLNNAQDLLQNRDSDTPLVRWSIFAIALISIWFWLVQPLQNWNKSLTEQIEQNAQKSVRLVALQEYSEQWAAAEKLAVKTFEQELSAYFIGTSDTAVQADILALIKQQSLKRELTVESQKLLPAEIEVGIGIKLPIAMNIRGELANVLTLLDDLSQASHIVQIDRWVIRKERNNKFILQVSLAGYRTSTDSSAASE